MASHASSISSLDDGFDSRLLAALLKSGDITSAAGERAQRAASQAGERLDRVLLRLGLIEEPALIAHFASLTGMRALKAEAFPDYPLYADTLSTRFIRHAMVVPVDEVDGTILLAAADPFDEASAHAISLKLDKPVQCCLAASADIENAIERLYGEGKSSIDTLADALSDDSDDQGSADIARLKDLANDAPVIRIVNLLIRKAIETRASDIHIEPYDAHMRVRMRIDGTLSEVDAPPIRLHPAILSRLKIMAKLNIAERRLPQDGRIKAVISGREVDIRVATTPTLHGEAAVLRLLDKTAVALDFETLGLDETLRADLNDVLSQPNGIFLVTGPTGSGKTTTLYAALKTLNDASRKIITVEDPVEYQLEGVTQIQARPDIGLDFAHALRSILRQDPDVIMVGEIRDIETARIAVQAALTGHLVLATLHTNSAAAAVGRLLDMGVEDYLLASTLVGVLAQRLVPRLCNDCKTMAPVLPDLARHIGDSDLKEAYTSAGCPTCQDRGTRGRTAIGELLTLNDGVRASILRRRDAAALHTDAVASGMISLRANGLLKVRSGDCSLSDVLRITSADSSAP